MNDAEQRVAVVDDEEPVRRGLERLLRAAGFAVESYPSGQAFLATLGGSHPDCLVLDLHMPGIDGFGVLAGIAAAHAAIPVVIITGYDTQESREEARRWGVAAYLRKPLDGQELADAIVASIAGA